MRWFWLMDRGLLIVITSIFFGWINCSCRMSRGRESLRRSAWERICHCVLRLWKHSSEAPWGFRFTEKYCQRKFCWKKMVKIMGFIHTQSGERCLKLVPLNRGKRKVTALAICVDALCLRVCGWDFVSHLKERRNYMTVDLLLSL